jgi:hypothetical protein
MKKTLFRSIFALHLLVILSLALSACSQATPIPGAAAPEGGKIGVRKLINTHLGYAVEFPSNYDIAQYSETGVSLIIGSLLNTQQPRADIRVEAAEQGLSVDQIADQFAAEYEGFDLARNEITVDGVKAIVFDQVPGQDFFRVVMFVHGGRLYHLTFSPADASLGETFTQMETLYNTVIGSFDLDPGP